MNDTEDKGNPEADHSKDGEIEKVAANQDSNASNKTEPPTIPVGLTASDIIPADILSQLPPEAQKVISVQLTQMRGRLSPGPSPIAQKLSPEHITAIIQNGENESVRDFDLAKIAQNTRRIGMGAVLAVITIILIYAGITKDKDLSEKIIFASISAIGGYGYGKSESRTD